MNKRMRPRVLIDLNAAMNHGHCGIATENRLLFKMLSELDQVEANGLLLSPHMTTLFSRYKRNAAMINDLLQTDQFFHEALQNESHFKNKLFAHLKSGVFFALKKRAFDLYDTHALYHDVIWRNVFMQTLNAQDKALIQQQTFCYSDLTPHHLRFAAYLDRGLQLKTTGYDFALFLEPSLVSVSPQTKKIVRFHDAIALTNPDFVSAQFAKGKWHTLKRSFANTHFVCNSEPSRHELLTIAPQLEKNTDVIPCALPTHYQKVNDVAILKKIMRHRLATSLLNPQQIEIIRAKISQMDDIPYLLHLATLDPKKNQLNLIKAWEQLNYHYLKDKPIQLVMVANSGPFAQPILDYMKPHVERGHIIHLSHLSDEEMPYLYSHAKAFVFPSYTEGFGLPPIEALQCDCPVIVSDIPSHRWVLGEAAQYCDPYDLQSITQAMAKLLTDQTCAVQREALILKGRRQIERYKTPQVKTEWAALFERLK